MTTPLSITAKNAIRALLRDNNINARGMSDAELLEGQASLLGEEIIITALPNQPARRIAATPKPMATPAPKDKPAPKLTLKKPRAPMATPKKEAAPKKETTPKDDDVNTRTKSTVEYTDITKAEYHRTLINTMNMNNKIMQQLLDDMNEQENK